MVAKLLEKMVPTAVKSLGVPAILELIGAAGLAAGGVNFILDKTFSPVVDKGTALMKEKIAEIGEKKKAELEEKKAALLAQKNEIMEATSEEEQK